MRRSPHDNPEYRLDKILKRKADAGVKIYVSVYKEVEQALTVNSAHTKNALNALGPNVRVMRHPDHNVFENAADMTMYWAHHEKYIVVDYDVAFIGGLDLCFGRYDVRHHPLADCHPEDVHHENWPGQDFNNNRISDFKNVQQWQDNELDKSLGGRMPWHDVSVSLIGPCVIDIAESFVLRWNHVKREKYKRESKFDWLVLEGREGEDEDLTAVQRPKHPVGEYIKHPLSPLSTKNLDGVNGTVRAQLVRSAGDWSMGILKDNSIQNAYSEIIRNAQHYVYIENQFFITATGDKQYPIRNQIGRAMVDAVVRADKENRKFKVICIIPAVPGFAGDLRGDAATGTRAIMDYQYKSICRGEHSIFGQIQAQGVDPKKYIFFFNLRSFDRLNRTAALIETEKKTGIKYAQVQRAQAEEVMASGIHGVIGDGGERDEHMGNEKQQEQLEVEIEKALEAKKIFEAAMPKDGVKTTSSVAHYAMAEPGSLVDEPWDEEDPDSEIKNWVQEELYIHSKLLIADDKVVICGSSNLNDRSQQGDHDSELSIVLEDTRKIQSTMAGEPYEASYLATTLRRFLWREHMGLLPAQSFDAKDDINAMPASTNPENDIYDKDDSWKFVEDPLNDELWQAWTSQADKNTKMFRHLFHADPDDHIKTFDDYDRFLPPRGVKPGHIFDQFMPADELKAKVAQIKGHLVWFPLEFLKDAEMAERGLQVNALTESVYT